MKIGTNKNFTKFANKDPNPSIPFVDAYPPPLGTTYWLVVAVLTGLFAASIYLDMWK